VECTVFSGRTQGECNGQPFHVWQGPDCTSWVEFFRQPAGFLIRFPDLADFELAADGSAASAWPVANLAPGTLQHLYQNQVEPLQRSLAGQLCFHASAVDVEGHAAAFMGRSGQGKSTLASSLAMQTSAKLLSDDAIRLSWQEQTCFVMPSHPSVRLWQDSASALVSAGADAPRQMLYNGKACFLSADDQLPFNNRSTQLKRCYLLGEGDASTPQATRLSAADAMISLMRNTFLLEVDRSDVLSWHFDTIAQLAQLPVFYRLDYPRRYEALPAVHRFILSHITLETSE